MKRRRQEIRKKRNEGKPPPSSSSNSNSNNTTGGTKKAGRESIINPDESERTLTHVVAPRRSARLSSASSSYKPRPTSRPQPSRSSLIKPKSPITVPGLRSAYCGSDFDHTQYFLKWLKRSLTRRQYTFRYGPDYEEKTCILSCGVTFSLREESSGTSWIGVSGTKAWCVVSMNTLPELDEKSVWSPEDKPYPPINFTMSKALCEMGDTSVAFRQKIAQISDSGPFAVVSVAPGTVEEHEESGHECQHCSRVIKFLEAKLKGRSTLTITEAVEIAVCALKYLFGPKFNSSEIPIRFVGGNKCLRESVSPYQKLSSTLVDGCLAAMNETTTTTTSN